MVSSLHDVCSARAYKKKKKSCSKPEVIDISSIHGVMSDYSTIRVTTESPPRLSAIDLTMVVCQVDSKYSSEIFNKTDDEVSVNYGHFKFPGQGQRETPVVTATQAFELIMVLKGKMAGQYRKQMADIIRRYFAGDSALHAEVVANNTSVEPLNAICRAELDSERAAVVGGKRARDGERMDKDMEFLITYANRSNQLFGIMQTAYDNLSVTFENDPRLKLQIVDAKQSSALLHITDLENIQTRAKMLGNGGGAIPSLTSTAPTMTPMSTPITISSLMHELGIKDDKNNTKAKQIGREAARLYREKYNRDPDQHDQFVGGRVTKVKSYTEKDRVLLLQSIENVKK